MSAKERLIALLEEERQAVIHQAVTRGLDPNVKLKPSGVEWLGDVPEHWEIHDTQTKIRRYIFREGSAHQAHEMMRPCTTGQYPFHDSTGDIVHSERHSRITDPYELCGQLRMNLRTSCRVRCSPRRTSRH